MVVKLLLADLDNTLVPYVVPLPDSRLMNWRDELYAYGITLFVLSNNRKEHRPRVFSEGLEVPYIGHAGKPKTGSFYKAMEMMHVTKEQTALVGDQVFTDIWGANLCGMPSVQLMPMDLASDNAFVRFKRKLERPVTAHYMKKRGVIL